MTPRLYQTGRVSYFLYNIARRTTLVVLPSLLAVPFSSTFVRYLKIFVSLLTILYNYDIISNGGSKMKMTESLLDLLSDWLKGRGKIYASGSECYMLQNMINSSREEIRKVEAHLRGLGVEDSEGIVI